MAVTSLPALHVPTAAELAEWKAAIDALQLVTLSGAAKTSDTSRASTTTFSNDPHLTAAVVAGGVYGVEFYGLYQAGATGQLKTQWTFPSGTFESGSFAYDPGTDDWQPLTAASSPGGGVTGLVGTGGNVPLRLAGTLHVGATGGTLALQWAQTTSNATATILRKGCRITLVRYS